MELNWFKINADFYNDSRVVYVETQKNGAVILHHYLKLQCMAARSNRQGGIFITEKLSHNANTLANEWHLKADAVKKSLEILEEAGLIEIIDGVIFIADWDRVQSADRLEQIRKSNRERVSRWREKQKNMSRNVTQQ